ncbi:hypothetical protein M405DRAFT_861240 [Rhizopogon salebrosus TDB-379]|nr:hypothetical protein M405DRAFT_861240 [Rhizopogon salebrosus TDB-379]
MVYNPAQSTDTCLNLLLMNVISYVFTTLPGPTLCPPVTNTPRDLCDANRPALAPPYWSVCGAACWIEWYPGYGKEQSFSVDREYNATRFADAMRRDLLIAGKNDIHLLQYTLFWYSGLFSISVLADILTSRGRKRSSGGPPVVII